jgi:hypothetical protein
MDNVLLNNPLVLLQNHIINRPYYRYLDLKKIIADEEEKEEIMKNNYKE